MADQQHEKFNVWLYFMLAFGITWGAILALVLPGGIPGNPDALATTYPLVFLAMAAGPPLAAFVALASRPDKLRALGRAMVNWRVPLRYYLAAILTAPAAVIVSLWIAMFFGDGFMPAALGPNGTTLVVMGLVFGLAAGFFEEIGWSGFATPALRRRYGLLTTGLLLGTVHGIWHLLAGFWGEGAHYGWLYLPYYMLLWIVGLIALRLLIVWLYERTQSVLITQLAHASYTGGLFILWPTTQDPLAITWWGGGFAILLLAIVLAMTRPWGAAPQLMAPAAAGR